MATVKIPREWTESSLGVARECLPVDLLKFHSGRVECIRKNTEHGLVCCRRRGHTGRHAAAGMSGRILAVWE